MLPRPIWRSSAALALMLAASTALAAAASPDPGYSAGLMRQLEAAMHPPSDAASALTGTGFFVSAGGELLTAEHVVRGCSRIDVVSEALPVMAATVVAADARPDLALLRIGHRPQAVPAALGFAVAGPAEGEALAVLGYPLGSDMRRATATKVRAVDGSNPRLRSSPYVLMLAGAVAEGGSGAPILDEGGEVVGLIKGGSDDPVKAQRAFGAPVTGISAGPARALIEIFYRASGLGALPAPAGAVGLEAARAAVVRVVCWRATPSS
jgi:S1-C subfamily serine protease